MAKPQVVLVPGCWHTPAPFAPLIARLESHGYTVLTTQLPSVGSDDNPPRDLTQDVTTVRDLVLKAIGPEGNDVVVVPHSWGGLVAQSALTGLGKTQREAKGEKGGVTKIAIMCGFLVNEGVSLMNLNQDAVAEWWEVKDDLAFVKPSHAGQILYNDLPASQQADLASQLRSHSFATMKAKATGEAWMEIPTWYLLCEEDQTIPPVAQEAMGGAAKERGADIEVQRIKSGHSPFVSKTEEVVEWVRRAAGENV